MITKFEVLLIMFLLQDALILLAVREVSKLADNKVKEAVKAIEQKAKTLAITHTAKFLKESLIDE